MGRTFYRLIVAHVNRARYDVFSGEYVQSFAAKYRIKESGDYTSYAKANEKKLEFARSLGFLGIKPGEVSWEN
jgi:hypothetical protein